MKNIKTTTRRTKRTAALIAFPGVLLVAASAGTALMAPATAHPAKTGEVHALSCPQSGPDKDKSGYGHIKGDFVRYRSGPSTGCAALGQENDGTKIYYHCYVGSPGNSWTHGRVAGTQREGWFFDKYLSDNGSYTHC